MTRRRPTPTGTSDVEKASSNRYDQEVTLVEPKPDLPTWTFLTNYAHVMVALSRDPDLRQRDLGYVVGITPGAVQRILDELEGAGYLRRERVGRRNHYEIIRDAPLRHPLEGRHTVGELLDMLRD
jgi:DNA-binding transcriptional ArsR family regulator